MWQFVFLALTAAISFAGSASALSVSRSGKEPNDGRLLFASSNQSLVEYVYASENLAIGFPHDWVPTSPIRNEVAFYVGQLRGVPAACFVRVSTVPNLGLGTPDGYFEQMDRQRFEELTSISIPDVKVHLFDFGTLGGRKARRIIYSGTDGGVKLGNLVYQTLDGDKIVTATCATEQEQFGFIYGELDEIMYSFRFLH